MGMSDEALLRHLNEHPDIRNRIESMLLIIEDEMGELQEADAVEMRLIEEMRQMGHKSLQAWATRQVVVASDMVAKESGAWKEGKKNSTGTAHLAKSS